MVRQTTPFRRREPCAVSAGYGEHSGRYLFVFELLARAGIACYTYDAHGHGLSEPSDDYNRVLVWDFADLVNPLTVAVLLQPSWKARPCNKD